MTWAAFSPLSGAQPKPVESYTSDTLNLSRDNEQQPFFVLFDARCRMWIGCEKDVDKNTWSLCPNALRRF